MRKKLLLITFTLTLIAGCATLPPTLNAESPQGENQPTPSPPSPEDVAPTSPRVPEQPTPIPVEDNRDTDVTPRDIPTNAVLVYHRSGGIAGIDETWTIYSDGRVTNDQGGEWQVSPEKVTALLNVIDDMGFFDMQINQGPADTCCDLFTYELAVLHEGRVRQVIAMDGEADIPEAFWQILTEVQRFLDEFSA